VGSSYRLVGNLYYRKMIDLADAQALPTLHNPPRGISSGMGNE
jgi:hypothetical protein